MYEWYEWLEWLESFLYLGCPTTSSSHGSSSSLVQLTATDGVVVKADMLLNGARTGGSTGKINIRSLHLPTGIKVGRPK